MGPGASIPGPELTMVEIEIDKKTYKIDFSTFPPSAIKRIEELKRRMENGDLDAAYDGLVLLTGARAEIINELDVRQITEFYIFIGDEANRYVRLHSH